MRGLLGLVLCATVAAVACSAQSLHLGTKAGSFPKAQCQPVERLDIHYHSHLDILVRGTPTAIPAGIGLRQTCIYWVHTHDTSGIIHIEAPADHAETRFTLGTLFQVWGVPLASDQVGPETTRVGEHVYGFVDGAQYHGDLRLLPFADHAVITLEIDTTPKPPPPFTWPTGF